MTSPSQAHLNSDAVPTGVLNSIVSNSFASAHSDIISDPVQLERELAHEVLNQDLATSEHDVHLKGSTISYEKALERELEYQKRINLVTMQHLARNGLLHKISQEELPSKPSVVGVKRKAACGILNVSSPPPNQLQGRVFRPTPLQQWQSQHEKPPPPLPQGFRLPLQRKSQDQQHLQQKPRPANIQGTPLWCNLCMVKCLSPLNLMSHYQGKKHKAKWDEVFGGNGAAGATQAASLSIMKKRGTGSGSSSYAPPH